MLGHNKKMHEKYPWESPPNVSHCFSLSAYLIDAIVISELVPKRDLNRADDAVEIGGCVRVPTPFNWETP